VYERCDLFDHTFSRNLACRGAIAIEKCQSAELHDRDVALLQTSQEKEFGS